MADSGLELDEYFDLVIDETGDLSSVSDRQELQKDLAGEIWEIIHEHGVGNVLTNNLAVELEARVRDAVRSDPRVTSVQDISLARTSNTTEARVYVEFESVYGPSSVSV